MVRRALSDTITTERLTLEPPKLADVSQLFAFLGDPSAMTYTQCDKDLVSCRRRIAIHEWRRRHDGYAPWTVRCRDTRRIIGWGGLYDDPFDPGWGPELAFFFHPAAWGKGYGAELSQAALSAADNELRLPLVSAFAHPDNRPSDRLLRKLGFVQQCYLADMDRRLYQRRPK